MNNNFFFGSTIKKAYLIGLSIFWGMVLLGTISEHIENSKPVVRKPWLKGPFKNDIEIAEKRKLRLAKKKTSFTYSKAAWNNDKNRQTENWADFLEELDNRGYSIYDPEAIDIWEKYK